MTMANSRENVKKMINFVFKSQDFQHYSSFKLNGEENMSVFFIIINFFTIHGIFHKTW